MMRFTTYLLLASFLHLQTACCCGAGDTHGLPANEECSSEGPAADHGTTCPCGHRQTVAQFNGGYQSTVEHDAPHHQSPQHRCHLCVVTHLKYIGTSAAPLINHLLTYEFAPWVASATTVTRHLVADNSPSFRHCSGSLLLCGSLLRI